MTNVVIEPVYFVSGLNFPVGRLGALGALAIATIPFAVGLDAMRQLVFAGQPYITGTPSPEVEALILVAMTVVFTLLARWMIRRIERMARSRGTPVDPLAVSASTLTAVPPPSPDAPIFDPPDRGRGPRRHVRNLRTALLLGWRVESNWTDPLLFAIYTVAKPIASLLLLVVMIEIIGAGHRRQRGHVRTFVVLGSRAVGDARRRDRGARVVRARGPRALPDAQVPVRQPGDVPRRCSSAAAARGSRRARWGRSSRSCSRSSCSGCGSTSRRCTGRCSGSCAGARARARPRDRRPAGRDLPPDPPGELVLPGRVRGRAVPGQGVVFPLAVLPDRARGPRALNPVTWWVAGVRLAMVPDGPSSIGGEGSLWTAVTGSAAPDATTIVARLVRDRGAGYTRGDRHLPIERASCTGSRPARPDDWLVATRRSTGCGERRSEGAAMRIYEGSPRQDFEEVFRSIGAFLDAAGCATSSSSRSRTGSSSRGSSRRADPPGRGRTRSGPWSRRR